MPDYDADFYGWATEQATLLRVGRLEAIDVENVAEEIESFARGEKRELVHRLTVLLLHLLKWQFQPDLQGRRCKLTIEEQRLQLSMHLAENPSLASTLDSAFAKAYILGARKAERETGIDRETFPPASPWTPAQAMADDFYPL